MAALLIDDDSFALKLLGTQLQLLGFLDVTTCEDARGALAQLECPSSKIDLVFCDLQMPEIDGMEFVRRLVRIGFGGSLVLVSGEDTGLLQSVHELALAHKLRSLAALPKPVSSAKLRQVLSEHALGRTGSSADAAQPM
jgi:CheY-like chemotaxis protein